MPDALEEHDGKVSIGGRNIINLRFADDKGALAEEEKELDRRMERQHSMNFASLTRAADNRTRWKGIVANALLSLRTFSPVIFRKRFPNDCSR